VESAAKRSDSRFERIRGLQAEKIGRGRFMLQRSGGGKSVKNTRRVRALRKKGDAKPPEGIPWGFDSSYLRRRGRKKREGQEEERYFFPGPAEENPRGAKAQEGQGPTLT
jgi:hypothetical protein